MSDENQCHQSETLANLKKELGKYKDLLDSYEKDNNKYLKTIEQLKQELKDHKSAVESRVERISDVLVTNISHLRAIIDNISILSDRIAACENFKLNHTHEYTQVLTKLNNVEATTNKTVSNVDTLKTSVSKEISTMKKVHDSHSKFHWKLGVVATVGAIVFGYVVRMGSVQDLLTALFEWLGKP